MLHSEASSLLGRDSMAWEKGERRKRGEYINMTSIPRTHVVGGKNQSCKLTSDLLKYPLAHVPIQIK